MNDPRELAERVRAVCVQAALQAYEDAGVQGLCAEGRWEAAIGALRRLNLDTLANSLPGTGADPADSGHNPGG